MSARCDYKAKSPYKSISAQQRRRNVRRHGLQVLALLVFALGAGVLGYLKHKGQIADSGAAVATATPTAPSKAAAPTLPAVTAPLAVPEVSKVPAMRYDFYTELPKRQVGIQ